jgi:hypothetical protein
MKVLLRPLGLMLLAASALVSCQSDSSYHPANPPEKEQFELAKLTVYPDDVRTNLDQYTNTLVAWAGIIRSTDAIEAETGGKIYSETIFENHYFDWQEDKTRQGVKLLLSPSGEGQFRSELHLRKATQDATGYDAEKYIARGKLAIVYGTPLSVDPDGTIVLHYHYIRVFGRDKYNTNELQYGRLGQPIYPAGWNSVNVTDLPKAK